MGNLAVPDVVGNTGSLEIGDVREGRIKKFTGRAGERTMEGNSEDTVERSDVEFLGTLCMWFRLREVLPTKQSNMPKVLLLESDCFTCLNFAGKWFLRVVLFD